MKDRYDIELGGEIKAVLPMRYQILNRMRVGKKTISSKVGKKFGITRRKALDHLTILQDEGYVKSLKEPDRFPSGAVASARVFTKVREYEKEKLDNWSWD